MEQYTITGMSCAACQTRVEKAVSKVPGVISCSVSLLTNSMGVEGTASSSEIIEAVQAAGYGASVKGVEKADGSGNGTLYDESALEDHETPVLKKRLVSSIGFHRLPLSPHVFLHGTHDVELAASGFLQRKPCGDGAFAAPSHRDRHGDQPEILYQWL